MAVNKYAVQLYASIAQAVAVARGMGADAVADRLHKELVRIEKRKPGTYAAWLNLPAPPDLSPPIGLTQPETKDG